MKKVISIILSIILIFSVSAVNTSAGTDKASDIDGIIFALNAAWSVKEQMGLSKVDFEALTYSDSVWHMIIPMKVWFSTLNLFR